MRVYIKPTELKYVSPYAYRNSAEHSAWVLQRYKEIKDLLKAGRFSDALGKIPYGTEVYIDGHGFYAHEDDYGFSGVEIYFRDLIGRTEYIGAKNHTMTSFLANAKRSIAFKYVGDSYRRDPLFT